MKKKLFFKFFVFAVIGALVTMTSCKDYDDDISGLETQVTAVKGDLTNLQSSVTSAQGAATAAQTSATDALAKANQALAAAQAAGDAEDIAALEEEVAGIMEDLAAINEKLEALAGLEAQIEALMVELEAANAEQLAAIVADVEAMKAEIQGMVGAMVTSVELVYSAGYPHFFEAYQSWYLGFTTVIEKANIFEENIANAITFVKDAQVQTPTSFVVRVSPTNAELTPDMITLQNSLGVTYDNIEVVSVEPYKKLLSTPAMSFKSTNGGGLWEVKVQLKEYDEDEFNAATVDKDAFTFDDEDGEFDVDGAILFAVAVDNTKTEENPMIRKVISGYNLILGHEMGEPTADLYFTVNKKGVNEINNRFSKESISLANPGEGTVYAEKEWIDNTDVAIKTNPANTTTADDDRSALAMYPAVQGQPLKIEIADEDNKIRAMYVTLDFESNAIDSAPSEWNAWNGYSYTGLGTVVEGTTAEIIINNTSAINDIIGFRVFAVNYDGTLVDPDGKAFYVQVGTPAGTWPVVATIAIPESTEKTSSAAVAITLPKITNITDYTYTWTTDESEKTKSKLAFSVDFLKDDGSPLISVNKADGSWNIDPSTIKKIKTTPLISDWLEYKDGKVYNGTLTIINASQHVVATMNVSFKKELPTAAPKGFIARDGQIINGVHTSFMAPSDKDGNEITLETIPAKFGNTKTLGEIFQFGGTTIANYSFSFANSDKDDDGKLIAKEIVGKDEALTVAKEFIDNSTEHAVTVVYDFGEISTETKDSKGEVMPYKVPVYNFKIVYSNIYKTYTWNWATKAQLGITDSKVELPYKTTVKQDVTGYTVKAEHIYGVSTTSVYSTLLSKAEKLVIKSGKLISNVSKNEDYFTVEYASGIFTFKPVTADKLTVNVPSTLVISAKDYYDNDVVIEIPVTVTP